MDALRQLLVAIALAGSACVASAQSDWYSCRDARGNLLRDQFPPAGCVGEICRNNSATGSRTCSPTAETPEQRAQHEAAEKRQRECAKIARDQIRDDLRFLDKYWSDDIIEDERNRAVAEKQLHINDARNRLDGLEATKKTLETNAEFYGPKHPMPAQLKSEIELNQNLLAAQKLVTVALDKEMRQINEKYDSMRKRRRDLLEKGSAPSPCDSAISQ